MCLKDNWLMKEGHEHSEFMIDEGRQWTLWIYDWWRKAMNTLNLWLMKEGHTHSELMIDHGPWKLWIYRDCNNVSLKNFETKLFMTLNLQVHATTSVLFSQNHKRRMEAAGTHYETCKQIAVKLSAQLNMNWAAICIHGDPHSLGQGKRTTFHSRPFSIAVLDDLTVILQLVKDSNY